jgi:hypothetical protein
VGQEGGGGEKEVRVQENGSRQTIKPQRKHSQAGSVTRRKPNYDKKASSTEKKKHIPKGAGPTTRKKKKKQKRTSKAQTHTQTHTHTLFTREGKWSVMHFRWRKNKERENKRD